ncbi:MAG: hypothetical protein AW11_02443 [Candidatus Accumulibacter regalis]|uniref:Uncharacterized protein n=1 Tax=Accumulibacter regalis TaxID=522306 RepID=A0A011R8W3_ACCRE|nr:hypothetical protein [Accumulibacter sp.]EXI87579.1 MAG: hypothetical protein AW11_02443 [Candidatus Accumulibacter regalis]HRE69607.1 hypothetical protein [Accumulibacter sp.]HRE87231.1 hypothetical protein [Accumulibacter sp.]
MKKILASTALIAGLLGSGTAFAQTVTTICPLTSGSTAAGPGAVPASGTAGTHYMTRAIAPKCSANTNVSGVDGTAGAWYAVGANSIKGKTNFGGHTNGGAVAKTVDCAIPGGCTVGESQTARGVANTAAGGT